MNISTWISTTTSQLQAARISSARLDAELLLAHALGVSRATVLSHPEQELNKTQAESADAALQRRLHHEPLAYIRGFVEFYGLELVVTQDVLIPRPETETLVEYAIKNVPRHATVLDCATGSGAIAVALKHHRPDLTITASDISPAALKMARANVEKFTCDIKVVESDLLTGVGDEYDYIITNLPYVRREQTVSPETAYEPATALYSEENGLHHYRCLFAQLKGFSACKTVILEAEPEQAAGLQAITAGWNQIYHDGFCYVFAQ